MRKLCIVSLTAAIALIAACGPSRKAAAPAAGTAPPMPPPPVRPSNGVYAPGTEELNALTATGQSATPEVLSQGYALYTGASCTKCHGTKSITSRPAAAWPRIIDDMAAKARLSGAEKDAVLKYVLAIKATQAK